MRGMPHTVKVERHQNELVVHVALLHGPDARLPGGVLLHTEGWVDIGYGLKMFLVIGSGNISYHPEDFRSKSVRRVEFGAQALNVDLESFTSYWSDTLALRNTDRSQTAVKLIEAYLARHGKKFDEEAVARVDKEMGRYQDMAILNP